MKWIQVVLFCLIVSCISRSYQVPIIDEKKKEHETRNQTDLMHPSSQPDRVKRFPPLSAVLMFVTGMSGLISVPVIGAMRQAERDEEEKKRKEEEQIERRNQLIRDKLRKEEEEVERQIKENEARRAREQAEAEAKAKAQAITYQTCDCVPDYSEPTKPGFTNFLCYC